MGKTSTFDYTKYYLEVRVTIIIVIFAAIAVDVRLTVGIAPIPPSVLQHFLLTLLPPPPRSV